MVTPFDHLSDENRSRLFALAERATYDAEASILREGSDPEGIFVVRSGTVRVEKDHLDGAILVDELDEGQVFGEMSFVQGSKASASVVADGEVEIDLISGERLGELLSDPGFAAEFYRSIAITLADRLRLTTERAAAVTFSWG